MDEKEQIIKLIIFAVIIPVIGHLIFFLAEKWHYDFGWFEKYDRKKCYILEGVIGGILFIYAKRFDPFGFYSLNEYVSPTCLVILVIMVIIDKIFRPNYDNEFDDKDITGNNITDYDNDNEFDNSGIMENYSAEWKKAFLIMIVLIALIIGALIAGIII